MCPRPISYGMDIKELTKLAELARISVSNKELEGFQKDMEAILKYVSHIQELEIREDEKTEKEQLRNVMREDEQAHESGIYTDNLLSQVPEAEREYVKVKKIL